MIIKSYLKKLLAGLNLTRSETAAVLDEVIDGETTDAQIAAFLTALAIKGETVEELVGLVQVMRSRARSFQTRHTIYVDTAGTGGDGRGTFNISTTAGFVVAGAGVAVAKHGNRAVSSLSGSADVLSELGVRVVVSPEIATKCLDEIGICFMFAPAFHPATKRVAEIRRQLGFRTAFNLLGPLTNPAGTPRQIVGVFAREYVDKCASVLAELGAERAWVVWGEDGCGGGLDEISLCGKTYVAEVIDARVDRFELLPSDFGLKEVKLVEILGDTPLENAVKMKEILSGKQQGGLRSAVIASAAAALYIADAAPSLKDSVKLAEESIDSGKAIEKLGLLADYSQQSD